jgi:fatty-acyl-CoA synthase
VSSDHGGAVAGRANAAIASDAPLSPLRFLQRSASVWRDSVAIGFERTEIGYERLLDRVERLAGRLRLLGAGPGTRVATLLPNVPAMLELHYAVPACGSVLVPMNTRLTREDYAYILADCGATILVADERWASQVRDTVARLGSPPDVVVLRGSDEYDALLADSDRVDIVVPEERSLLSLNYTSGTTGKPKGVMYTHRGAYLQALAMITEASLESRSTYLWTLPMFHCNGWAFTWAVTAVGGRHECLRGFDPAEVWSLLGTGKITHLCAAPTVLTMLAAAPVAARLEAPLRVLTGGAPPAPALLTRAAQLGMTITHLYGLTETYGPIAVCTWRSAWDRLDAGAQARLQARQGVANIASQPLRVVDVQLRDVPADGSTLGEVVMRGNNVTTGYYGDPEATAAAFAGGWFHSGDLAVMHPDGYIELRDRLKDVIISGGENISTIEVEQAIAMHPDVLEVAVVGVPDEVWGEVPKAFVTLKGGDRLRAEDLHKFVQGRIARFKEPREIEFVTELPKTATGKIQKYLLRARPGAAVSPAQPPLVDGDADREHAAQTDRGGRP